MGKIALYSSGATLRNGELFLLNLKISSFRGSKIPAEFFTQRVRCRRYWDDYRRILKLTILEYRLKRGIL